MYDVPVRSEEEVIKKTLEAQRTPFRRGAQRGKAAIDKILRYKICHLPSKPPSSPRTSLHGNRRDGWRRFLALLGRRLPRREVFGWIGRCEGFAEYGFAPDWWVVCVGRVYAFRKCRLIPPHQSLTRQLPPKGKPLHPFHFSQQDGRVEIRKLGCFCNSACFLIFCLLPEIVFTMFARAYKRLPLGWEENCKQFVA